MISFWKDFPWAKWVPDKVAVVHLWFPFHEKLTCFSSTLLTCQKQGSGVPPVLEQKQRLLTILDMELLSINLGAYYCLMSSALKWSSHRWVALQVSTLTKVSTYIIKDKARQHSVPWFYFPLPYSINQLPPKSTSQQKEILNQTDNSRD